MERFVIDDFPGLFVGTSLSKLPPGAALPGRGILEPKAQTLDVQFSEDNECIPSAGYSRIMVHDPTALGYINAVYHWEPPKGGDVLLASVGSGIGYLYFPTPTGSTGPYFNLVPFWIFVGRYAPTTPYNFGMFEPFQDRLYYVDEVNPPLRITRDASQGFLQVEEMGLSILNWTFSWPSVYQKPYYGLGDKLVKGPLTYTFTGVTPYGETPTYEMSALPIYKDMYFNDSYYYPGPFGTTPVILFDWGNAFPYVSGLNIYRTEARGNQFYWVGYVSKGQASWMDTTPDEDLVQGFPMPTDNYPPSKLRLIRAFQDRMFGVGGYTDRNRVSFSKVGLPDIWPPLFELPTLDTSRGGDITQMYVIGGTLYFFMSNRIMRLSGSNELDYRLDEVLSGIGCIAPRTMVPWNEGVVFLAKDGLYFFNGSFPTRLSASLYGLFSKTGSGELDLKYSSGAITNGYYYLSYSEKDEGVAGVTSVAPYPNRVLVCNLRTGRWGARNVGAFFASCSYKGDRSIAVRCTSTTSYRIELISDWLLQDNTHPNPRFYIGHLDFGYPDQVKVLEKVEIVYESLAEAAIKVTAYREYSNEEPSTSVSKEAVTDSYVANTSDPVWGDTWDAGKYYSTMKVRRSFHYFQMLQAKTFSFSIDTQQDTRPSPAIRIEKVICHFNLEKVQQYGKSV